MSRLIFLNRYFFPDHSATSQLLTDLAFYLSAAGNDVHVITSQQLYNDHKARLPRDEVIRGVHIHRVRTTRFGRSSLIGRAFDYLSYYASTWRVIRNLARQNDIIIAKTDPPLISVVAMLVARRRGARLVNWLQDLYPEVAMQLRIPFVRKPISNILCSLRNRSLNAAALNVVVGKLMREKLLSLGIRADRVRVVPNWSNDQQIYPMNSSKNPLRSTWGLQDKFVIGYSGNLGRAHEYHTILSAAERLKNEPNIVFLFVGGGHHFDELARSVIQNNLGEQFQFIPYQDRLFLNYALNVPDVHWISLRPEVDGLIVPSKIYGIAAAGKPVIAITYRNGEIAHLVRDHGCGIVVEPGDGNSLADAIIQLKKNPESRALMGQRARHMLDTRFTRKQAFERWDNVIDAVQELNEPAVIPRPSNSRARSEQGLVRP